MTLSVLQAISWNSHPLIKKYFTLFQFSTPFFLSFLPSLLLSQFYFSSLLPRNHATSPSITFPPFTFTHLFSFIFSSFLLLFHPACLLLIHLPCPLFSSSLSLSLCFSRSYICIGASCNHHEERGAEDGGSGEYYSKQDLHFYDATIFYRSHWRE